MATTTARDTTTLTNFLADHQKRADRKHAALIAKHDQATKALREREQAAADAAERLLRLEAEIDNPLAEVSPSFEDHRDAKARTLFADRALEGARKAVKSLTTVIGPTKHIGLAALVAAAFGDEYECEHGATTADGYALSSLDSTNVVIARVIESRILDNGGIVGSVELVRVRSRHHAPIDLETIQSVTEQAGIPAEKLAPGNVWIRTAKHGSTRVDTVRLRVGPVVLGSLALAHVTDASVDVAARSFVLTVAETLALRSLGNYDDGSFVFADGADGRLFAGVSRAQIVKQDVADGVRTVKATFRLTTESHGVDHGQIAKALRIAADGWSTGITVLGIGKIIDLHAKPADANPAAFHENRAWQGQAVMVDTAKSGPWSPVVSVVVELTATSLVDV